MKREMLSNMDRTYKAGVEDEVINEARNEIKKLLGQVRNSVNFLKVRGQSSEEIKYGMQ